MSVSSGCWPAGDGSMWSVFTPPLPPFCQARPGCPLSSDKAQCDVLTNYSHLLAAFQRLSVNCLRCFNSLAICYLSFSARSPPSSINPAQPRWLPGCGVLAPVFHSNIVRDSITINQLWLWQMMTERVGVLCFLELGLRLLLVWLFATHSQNVNN